MNQTEAMNLKLKWKQAPVKTTWGHDTVEATIALDEDHTLDLYCERSQIDKVEALLEQVKRTRPLTTQPVVEDQYGILRFKSNGLVNTLYEHGVKTGLGMNELQRMDFTEEDRQQFAQLIGYSVSGYCGLSYVTDEACEAARGIKPCNVVESSTTTPEATGIEKEVCDDIRARQEIGIKKYGVSVLENPLSHLEWLQHAYEESLGFSVYLKKAMHEIRNLQSTDGGKLVRKTKFNCEYTCPTIDDMIGKVKEEIECYFSEVFCVSCGFLEPDDVDTLSKHYSEQLFERIYGIFEETRMTNVQIREDAEE